MSEQQPSEEEIKAFQEKLAKMSPEEREQLFRQQCIFCQIIDGKVQSTKLYEDDQCIAILDINPANPGHVLLIPKKHFQVGPQVPEDVMKHMGKLTRSISNACLKSLKCGGTNVFIANGAAAGQRAQHFMIHIIPRKENDGLTCFELTEQKVDDKTLDQLAENLKKYIVGKLKVEISEEDNEPLPKNNNSESKNTEPKSQIIPKKLVKEKGYLYFVDKEGDVARCKMVRGRKKQKQKQEKVLKVGIERKPGLLYYVDKNLEIKTASMNRNGRKPSNKKKKSKGKKTKKKTIKTTAIKPKEKPVKIAKYKEENVSLDDISNLFT